MTNPARPAPAVASPDTTDDLSPLEKTFAELFATVDAGDMAKRDEILAEATEQKSAASEGFAKPKGPSAMPLKALLEATSKSRQDNVKAFAAIAGKYLPMVTRGDVPAHFRTLVAKGQHLESVVDTMLRDLAAREAALFRPTIFVGPPGCGKSWLARQLCSTVSLPFTFFPAGGVADGTFGGTAAHWSTSGPSLPAQGFVQHGVANFAIIVDEVDKSTQGSHNGSLQDVLLGFLDKENARHFRDPSLEAVVDCSTINWLLTANDLSQISEPLRDRCRIIQMPKPTWKHIGPIVRSILNDVATDRGIDPRWLSDLDGDEMQLVKKAWKEGSIRKLRRIVETVVDFRDRHLPRA